MNNSFKMTKILRIAKEEMPKNSKISREVLAKFGETIYNFEEVRAIRMEVLFKDNRSITFNRSKMSDTFEVRKEKEEEEEDEEDDEEE
jgi:hypothetical protein